VQGIVNRGIDDGRQKARRELVDKINLLGYGLADVPEMAAAETAKQKAYGLILGKGREVFNLDNEPTELRDRYGRTPSGRNAWRRGGWSRRVCPTSRSASPAAGTRTPTTSRRCGGSAPVGPGAGDAAGRSERPRLAGQHLVWCTGEFGRTPKISWEPPWNGGRHHHGDVFTVLVAGGGFKGGRVVGSSDEKGEKSRRRPVYPADLLGSMYLLAGIDATAKLPHPWGLDAHVLRRPEPGRSA
jgi:hypothetical protein